MHAHDHGLEHDLRRLLAGPRNRRHALRWLTGAAVASLPLVGCGGNGLAGARRPGG